MAAVCAAARLPCVGFGMDTMTPLHTGCLFAHRCVRNGETRTWRLKLKLFVNVDCAAAGCGAMHDSPHREADFF
eukprot:1158921-Pelagomonas_calceolata.AAC.4